MAGVPTEANQLKWSGPGWYAEGMHAISRGDDAALRRIVAGPGWKPDNANQKFKVDKHSQNNDCIFTPDPDEHRRRVCVG